MLAVNKGWFSFRGDYLPPQMNQIPIGAQPNPSQTLRLVRTGENYD